MHAKELINTGAKISAISQKSLPDNYIFNKFTQIIFDLTYSINIIGSSQISIELKDNNNKVCKVAVLGDNP